MPSTLQEQAIQVATEALLQAQSQLRTMKLQGVRSSEAGMGQQWGRQGDTTAEEVGRRWSRWTGWERNDWASRRWTGWEGSKWGTWSDWKEGEATAWWSQSDWNQAEATAWWSWSGWKEGGATAETVKEEQWREWGERTAESVRYWQWVHHTNPSAPRHSREGMARRQERKAEKLQEKHEHYAAGIDSQFLYKF